MHYAIDRQASKRDKHTSFSFAAYNHMSIHIGDYFESERNLCAALSSIVVLYSEKWYNLGGDLNDSIKKNMI